MTSKFTFSTDFGQDFIASVSSSMSFRVKVLGYWSGDSINVYIRRDSWLDKDQPWKFEISHSSGGRDTKEVLDDADAEENFGLALVATAAKVRELKELVPVFEANYQAYITQAKAKQAEISAAKQLKIDADPAMGEVLAKKMIKTMKDYPHNILVIRERGTGNESKVQIRTTRSGTQKFEFVNGGTYTRNQLEDLLAKSSASSTLGAPV